MYIGGRRSFKSNKLNLVEEGKKTKANTLNAHSGCTDCLKDGTQVKFAECSEHNYMYV